MLPGSGFGQVPTMDVTGCGTVICSIPNTWPIPLPPPGLCCFKRKMTRPEVGIHLLVPEGLKVLRACPTHRGPWAGEFRLLWLCQAQALDYTNGIFTGFSLIREGNVTLGQVRRPWLWPLPLDHDACCIWNSLPPNVGRGYSQWLPYV